ncbi:MAG: GNAT family N-acetyltransferase [Clostridia bacterium]|nr:GNAT family N-acetyltransferase [Clostridia bacterium]
MEYKISILKDSDRIPELVTLFRTGLGETTEAFWKWRLFTENGQPDQPFAMIIDDEKERMVGISSVLPVLYGYGESERKCLQFCDWVVHPEHRGKGLIRMMYDYAYMHFRDKGYDFIMEFPNDNSYPIFQKYGFCEEPHIHCWSSSKHVFIKKEKLHDIHIQDKKVCFSEKCPAEIGTFIRQDRIARTPAYLKWKYDQNPDIDYKWVTLWQDEICIGYMVYTLTRGRFRTAVNVYDWEYPNTDSTILHKIISILEKQGNYISIWGRYDQNTQKLLEQCGLRKVECRTRLMLKDISERSWPTELTLTRIDTDY